MPSCCSRELFYLTVSGAVLAPRVLKLLEARRPRWRVRAEDLTHDTVVTQSQASAPAWFALDVSEGTLTLRGHDHGHGHSNNIQQGLPCEASPQGELQKLHNAGSWVSLDAFPSNPGSQLSSSRKAALSPCKPEHYLHLIPSGQAGAPPLSDPGGWVPWGWPWGDLEPPPGPACTFLLDV